jgi:acyl carrier protein
VDTLEGKRIWIDYVFAGREPLDDHKLWKRHFRHLGVAMDTVVRVRRILSQVLEADLSRIRDWDDFSKELAFFWEFDSLADMTMLVALEDEFGIAITDAEAQTMNTLKDIVLHVQGKLSSS